MLFLGSLRILGDPVDPCKANVGDLDEGDIIVYREDIEDHDGNVLAEGCWSSEKWIF